MYFGAAHLQGMPIDSFLSYKIKLPECSYVYAPKVNSIDAKPQPERVAIAAE